MKWTRKIKENRETQFELIYLVLIAVFLFAWAVIQPNTFSPDEQMRYKVVDYIFRHNALPHGGDPEVLDASWGISYAFYPVLSYLVSYIFMKLVSIFTMDSFALLVAARMAEVAFGVGTAFYTMKIGKRFFKGEYQKLFLCLVTLLPGAFVLFSYVNCDSLALFATAMLIYSWIRGLEDEWSYKSCIRVALGVSICALSYYNAYGVIVATVAVFTLSILFCEEKKWNFKKLFARGLFITGIVAVLAGWWFVRNYVLYDGDIWGLHITTEYAEKFAEEARKPSNRYTFQMNPDINVIGMLFFQPESHAHNWMLMVYYSFIGAFGYMNIWPPEWIGKVFMVFFLFGLVGVLPMVKKLFALRKVNVVKRCGAGETQDAQQAYLAEEQRLIRDGQGEYFAKQSEQCCTPVGVKYTYRLSRWRKEGVFHIGLLITMILPNMLNIYNSYAQDYQPQGRYSMPMLIPLMYFMILGYRRLFEKWGNKKAAKIFCYTICICMAAFLLYCYFGLVLPSCMRQWRNLGAMFTM